MLFTDISLSDALSINEDVILYLTIQQKGSLPVTRHSVLYYSDLLLAVLSQHRTLEDSVRSALNCYKNTGFIDLNQFSNGNDTSVIATLQP